MADALLPSQQIAAQVTTGTFDPAKYVAALVAEENANKLQTMQLQQLNPQLDAANEEAKRVAAFSQPRNDNDVPRSAAFLAINAAYEQQRGKTVSSGGTYQQNAETHAAFVKQPGYVENTGVVTGRAATQNYGAPLQQSRYSMELSNQPPISIVPSRDISSNAPTRAENLFGYNQYDMMALESAPSRAGYTTPSNIGDTITQNAVRMSDVARGFGFNVASNEAIAGRTLLAQQEQAFKTPGLTDDRFYSNAFQQLIENKVEVSSAYHHIGQKLDIPIPANRWEYSGDLAAELLKGEPRKDSERFSPASGEMSKYLPQYEGRGEGVQDYAWRLSEYGTKGAGFSNFSAGFEKLLSAEGQYGPYGKLYGGPEYKEPVSSKNYVQDVVLGQTIGITPTSPLGVEIGMAEGSIPKPFRAPSEPAQPNDSFKGFVDWVTGGDTDRFVKTAVQATGGRIQTTGRNPIDFVVASVPNIMAARPITSIEQVTNESQRNSILSPLTNQIELSKTHVNKFFDGSGQTKPEGYEPEGYGTFGVMAANEGALIKPDYSSRMSVESGMNYGLAPKPFMSVGKSGEFGISEATGAFPVVGVVPGLSNLYAFFQPGTKTTQVVGSPVSQPVSSVIGTPVVTTETIGDITYTTTTTPTTTTGGTVTPITTISSPTESGYDRLNATIRGTLNLPSKEEGERAMQFASLANPFAATMVVSSLLTEKLTGSKAGQTFEPLRGQYTQFYDQPILAPISYAVGAGFGVLGEGASVIGAAGKANIAERVISSGGSYRAADMFISKVSGAVPYVLGGAYVADIAGRSTKGFTEYAPENVASSAKGIAVQEAFPMMVGFGLPKQIVSGVSLAEQGYKQALERGTQIASTEAPKGIDKVLDLSGTTTGRFDYYVKQPAMKPYELLKQDYASFVVEKTIPQKVVSLESTFPPIQPGYTRVAHVTQLTPEIESAMIKEGLYINPIGGSRSGIEFTSVDLTGQGRIFPSAKGASTETWFKSAQETYLNKGADRNMFNNYERFGDDITIFDFKASLYDTPSSVKTSSGKYIYSGIENTGRGSYVGKMTRADLSNPIAIVPEVKPTFGQYIAERGGFNKAPLPEPTTLKYTPAQTGELAELAYGKQSTIFDIAKSRFDILPKSEPISLKYAPPEIPTGYQAEAAYGKQKTVFDVASESLTSAGKFTYKTMGFGKEITVPEPHMYSRYMSE
jgi:hypothetical protein